MNLQSHQGNVWDDITRLEIKLAKLEDKETLTKRNSRLCPRWWKVGGFEHRVEDVPLCHCGPDRRPRQTGRRTSSFRSTWRQGWGSDETSSRPTVVVTTESVMRHASGIRRSLTCCSRSITEVEYLSQRLSQVHVDRSQETYRWQGIGHVLIRRTWRETEEHWHWPAGNKMRSAADWWLRELSRNRSWIGRSLVRATCLPAKEHQDQVCSM